MSLTPLLRSYDHVLIDLDGCVWVGEEATPGAVEAIDALRAAGKGVAFVTNDARHATEEFVRKLWRLGFRASVEEVVTVGGAVQHVLAEAAQWSTAFVVGAPALHRHVVHAGLREVEHEPDVVVVAGHEGFDYAELRGAAQAVAAGADLICTSTDASFPMPDGPWPGTGAVVAAVEFATGVRARTIGKPAPQLYATALDRLGPGRALVVGDRADADLAGALAAGLDGALVGGAPSDDAVACSPTLGALVLA